MTMIGEILNMGTSMKIVKRTLGISRKQLHALKDEQLAMEDYFL